MLNNARVASRLKNSKPSEIAKLEDMLVLLGAGTSYFLKQNSWNCVLSPAWPSSGLLAATALEGMDLLDLAHRRSNMDLLYPAQHCIGVQHGRDQVTSLHLVWMKVRDRFYPDVLKSFDSPMSMSSNVFLMYSRSDLWRSNTSLTTCLKLLNLFCRIASFRNLVLEWKWILWLSQLLHVQRSVLGVIIPLNIHQPVFPGSRTVSGLEHISGIFRQRFDFSNIGDFGDRNCSHILHL